jgi:hypothetical protein
MPGHIGQAGGGSVELIFSCPCAAHANTPAATGKLHAYLFIPASRFLERFARCLHGAAVLPGAGAVRRPIFAQPLDSVSAT